MLVPPSAVAGLTNLVAFSVEGLSPESVMILDASGRPLSRPNVDDGEPYSPAQVEHQQRFEHEMGTIRLRFLVEDPDALFNEYRERGVECTATGIRDTPWGTREFALYDLDRNALTFYRDLRSEEKEHEPVA